MPDLEDEGWWQPVWQEAPDHPQRLPSSGLAALLSPLAQAVAALARLEARLADGSDCVAEGLHARIALREASGWLAHQGSWVHPTDLGLREAGLTGSYTAAAMTGRLRAVLPATRETQAGEAPVADDATVGEALVLAGLWRRLATRTSWSPLADTLALRQTLALIGRHDLPDAVLSAWLASHGARAAGDALPALIRAGQAAQEWADQDRAAGTGRPDRLSTAGLLLASCVWRLPAKGAGPGRHGGALPFWSAMPRLLDVLALRTGPDWLAGFLDCVTDAAQRAGQELTRLQEAERRAAGLARTKRSHLPRAAELALRRPVLTARLLADRLEVSHQAALGLLKQLIAAGVVREATGRAAWRAFGVG